jgi:metal-responsive CopG/Arc/MetJ family transcriptional regulator
MARLVQLRLPDELLRRVDRFVAEGLYRSRSELIVDATRRFLQRSAPTSGLELFIDSYMTGAVKPSKESSESLEELFQKLRKDSRWRAQLGDTPERLMRRLRSRAA